MWERLIVEVLERLLREFGWRWGKEDGYEWRWERLTKR
jgi:hypothetical protein